MKSLIKKLIHMNNKKLYRIKFQNFGIIDLYYSKDKYYSYSLKKLKSKDLSQSKKTLKKERIKTKVLFLSSLKDLI
jgi:hypothetical protein